MDDAAQVLLPLVVGVAIGDREEASAAQAHDDLAGAVNASWPRLTWHPVVAIAVRASRRLLGVRGVEKLLSRRDDQRSCGLARSWRRRTRWRVEREIAHQSTRNDMPSRMKNDRVPANTGATVLGPRMRKVGNEAPVATAGIYVD